MNYNRILHVLAAKSDGGSALYVNGKESQPRSEEMQRIVKLTYLAGKHKSPWCGIVNGCFFIKGFFENKDDRGNEMTFSYSADINSPDEGKRIFLSDIESLGYKVNEATSLCLKSQSKTNKMSYIVIAAIIVIFLIILLKVIK